MLFSKWHSASWWNIDVNMHIENVQGCHESLHAGEGWHAINDPFFHNQIPVVLYKAGTEIKIALH